MKDFFPLEVWAKNMDAHYTWQNMVYFCTISQSGSSTEKRGQRQIQQVEYKIENSNAGWLFLFVISGVTSTQSNPISHLLCLALCLIRFYLWMESSFLVSSGFIRYQQEVGDQENTKVTVFIPPLSSGWASWLYCSLPLYLQNQGGNSSFLLVYSGRLTLYYLP